jgi:ParB/RepB/Spo0J family partition protein
MMTATAVSELASLAIEDVFIRLLDVAPWNARKTFDPASLKELTESISQHGIQVPLLVRPGLKDRLEIVAGHRRFKAAEAVGLKSVPCIVRELDDDQAREIGLVDNLQREDVPALEEADAYAELQQRLGTAAAIAQRVGKEASYVARRLQLVSLAEMPRRALAERLITVDHALLLARLGKDEQDEALKYTLRYGDNKKPVDVILEEALAERKEDGMGGYYQPRSVVDLREHIEEEVGRKLSRAPWKLDDAELLPDAGACAACPKNTKANDLLFSDLAIDGATCEDGGCFESKRAAFVQIRLSEATKENKLGLGTAVRLSWKKTSVKPRFSEAKAGVALVDESGINLHQTFKVGQWVEAKSKSCAYVRLGVTIDWSDDANLGYMGSGQKLRKPGERLTVCIAPGCKAHKKEWEKPKSEQRNAPYDAKAAEGKREKTRLAALAETKLRVRIAGEAIDRVKALPLDVLRQLLIDQISSGREREAFNAILPGVEKILRTAKIDSAEFAKAVALVSIEGRHVEVFEYWEAKTFRPEFIADLKRLGYDASKAWEKPAEPKPEKKAAAKTAAKKPANKPAKKKAVRK